MNIASTDCALNVAYWFIYKAQKQNTYLDNDKLQALLALSQIHYALQNNKSYLMPSVFVCTENGFVEPNIAFLLSKFKLNSAFEVKFSDKVDIFLQGIWNKYASYTSQKLINFLKDSSSYRSNYIIGAKNIISLDSMINGFGSEEKLQNANPSKDTQKILLSQNGPVIVSQWHPKKINYKFNGDNNA